ncbi:uncharacterized protein LOC144132515 isoform X8 [Amblyomma americanum]
MRPHPVQKSSACSRAVWQMQSHWHRGDRTHATLRYPSELVPAVAPAVKCPETSIWNPACYLMCTVDFRTCHCNDGLGRTIHCTCRPASASLQDRLRNLLSRSPHVLDKSGRTKYQEASLLHAC